MFNFFMVFFQMKKLIFVMLFALLAFSADSFAKTVKEAKFTANMTCETCKGKIEKALKADKGVIKSNADVASKTVTVSYDADVTSESNLKSSITKLGYTVDATPSNVKSDCKPSSKSDCGTKCSKSCGGEKKK